MYTLQNGQKVKVDDYGEKLEGMTMERTHTRKHKTLYRNIKISAFVLLILYILYSLSCDNSYGGCEYTFQSLYNKFKSRFL